MTTTTSQPSPQRLAANPPKNAMTAPAIIARVPRTRTAVLRRSASGSHSPLVRLHAWSWLSICPQPLAKVASYVPSSISSRPPNAVDEGTGELALPNQPDVLAVLFDQIDLAVDGGLDQPGDLVRRSDALGVEQPALGRGELGRRREVGGGHLGQLGFVEPDLARRCAAAGVGRIGDAAGADALAP